MRTPQTLNGPVVARPATVGTQAAKATGKPAAQTPVRRGKIAKDKKVVAPTTR
jgi:hypothetical protein